MSNKPDLTDDEFERQLQASVFARTRPEFTGPWEADVSPGRRRASSPLLLWTAAAATVALGVALWGVWRTGRQAKSTPSPVSISGNEERLIITEGFYILTARPESGLVVVQALEDFSITAWNVRDKFQGRVLEAITVDGLKWKSETGASEQRGVDAWNQAALAALEKEAISLRAAAQSGTLGVKGLNRLVALAGFGQPVAMNALEAMSANDENAALAEVRDIMKTCTWIERGSRESQVTAIRVLSQKNSPYATSRLRTLALQLQDGALAELCVSKLAEMKDRFVPLALFEIAAGAATEQARRKAGALRGLWEQSLLEQDGNQ